MKVLIVDDEPIIVELYQEFICDYGDCDFAYNGFDAVEIFKKAITDQEPYDLICLDIMMPTKSGLDALAEMRQIEGDHGIHGYDRINVIMISAKDDSKTIINSFFDGRCEAYLCKPIEKKQLIKTISDLGLL